MSKKTFLSHLCSRTRRWTAIPQVGPRSTTLYLTVQPSCTILTRQNIQAKFQRRSASTKNRWWASMPFWTSWRPLPMVREKGYYSWSNIYAL